MQTQPTDPFATGAKASESEGCAACGGTNRPSPFDLNGSDRVLICDDCCDTVRCLLADEILKAARELGWRPEGGSDGQG